MSGCFITATEVKLEQVRLEVWESTSSSSPLFTAHPSVPVLRLDFPGSLSSLLGSSESGQHNIWMVPKDEAHSTRPSRPGLALLGGHLPTDFSPLPSAHPMVAAWVCHYLSCSWLSLLDGSQMLCAQAAGSVTGPAGSPIFYLPNPVTS